MMKKWMVSAALLIKSFSLDALALQNPADPCVFDCAKNCYMKMNCARMFQLGIGFSGDFIYNRYLKTLEPHKQIFDTEITTLAGLIVVNVCNRLDCFATVGESKLRIVTDLDSYANVVSLGIPNVMTSLDFANTFSWSAGVRGCALKFRRWKVGVEFEYERCHPKYNYFGSAQVQTNLSDLSPAFYEDWQLGIGLTSPVYVPWPAIRVYPYVGAKMGWARLFQNKTPFLALPSIANIEGFVLPDMKAAKLWGFVVGMSINVKKCAAVSCEGRFGDEKAFSTTAQFRY